MGQPESGDEAAADPARAGQGVWIEAARELGGGGGGGEEEDAGLTGHSRAREREAADAAQPDARLCRRRCCCCSRCLGGRAPEINSKTPCPGLGLFYTVLSAFFFSVASLFLKMIEDVHAVEVSAFRCIFQMVFVLPGIIYCNPVFTSLLAWIFLKEKYSPWDLLFTLFAITGVVLIARPPFLFGSKVAGIEGSYTDHLKGTIAALSSAICTSSTFVILRKVGISVHYFLSIWYYAVIGLIVCIIALFAMDVWTLPHCGKDRFLLILMGLFGLGGQIFLTKALQIEKAGPVSIMKTMDVVFAFIFQIIFLSHIPTWWTVGGALCVVASSSGTVLRKWRQSSKEAKQTEI
ncbi:solute carrier family 35 member G1-like isoform X5 [Paroedura picta]|uniref:solute carrier family 35 member G1-like isoform X5 n=1 Tax=Paroedura picta TaxID=143630 RepID=UPI004056EC86